MKYSKIIIFLSVFFVASSCEKSNSIKIPEWYFIQLSWGSFWNNEVKQVRILSTKDSLTVLTTVDQDSIINIKSYHFERSLRDSIFLLSYLGTQSFDILDTSNLSQVSDGGNNIKIKLAANDKTVENSYVFSNVAQSNLNIKNLLRIIMTSTGDTTIPN